MKTDFYKFSVNEDEEYYFDLDTNKKILCLSKNLQPLNAWKYSDTQNYSRVLVRLFELFLETDTAIELADVVITVQNLFTVEALSTEG